MSERVKKEEDGRRRNEGKGIEMSVSKYVIKLFCDFEI